jgi:hypothetical protein
MTDLPDNSPDQPVVPQPRSAPRTENGPQTLVLRPRPTSGFRPASRRTVDVLTVLINWAAALAAIVLALHILFVVFTTNGSNTIVSTVAHWARWLAWEFKDVFVPSNHKVSVLVNYGLAAIVYLIVGRVLVALLQRLAAAIKAG